MKCVSGSDYAVTYLDAPGAPLRPLRAVWTGEYFEVHDPDDPLDFPTAVPRTDLLVWGVWTEPVSEGNQTWQQFASEQHGHVLRQRHLVERLPKVGIKRDPEPYTHRDRISNHVEMSLVLNFDEIDLLLRRGGI